MDKLEAINTMLGHINQSPITTLNGNKTARILMAENLLESQTKAVQMLSYDFNRIENYPLYPNEDEEIILPANTLKVDICKSYLDESRYVQWGNRLYNKTFNTYKIGKYLEGNIIIQLEFEDLPEPVKLYVVMTASNKFVSQIKDDRNKIAYTEQEVFEAKQTLDEYEAECGDYNILNIYNTKRYLG